MFRVLIWTLAAIGLTQLSGGAQARTLSPAGMSVTSDVIAVQSTRPQEGRGGRWSRWRPGRRGGKGWLPPFVLKIPRGEYWDRPTGHRSKKRWKRKKRLHIHVLPPRIRRPRPELTAEPKSPSKPKARKHVRSAPPPSPPPPAPRGPDAAPIPVPRAVASQLFEKPHRPREIAALVALDDAEETRRGLMRDYNLLSTEPRGLVLLDTALLRLTVPDNRPLEEVIGTLQRDGRVLSVQPNYVYELLGEAAAQGATQAQYPLAVLNLPDAHALATGRDVPVAVIDTCVDAQHPALEGAIAEAFDAALEDEAAPGCTRGGEHGTAIAGIIAARQALQGVAPQARLLAASAFVILDGGTKPQATTTTLALSVDWATRKNARIFNMSFAGPEDPLLGRLVEKLLEKGALIVAAAGNAGPDAPPAYPAAYPGVVAVTAVDSEKKRYSAANRGAYIAVAAPGVDILVPIPEGSYDTASGTSYAAAHVSGIAALMLERAPGITRDAIRGRLLETAADLGEQGPDQDFGAGLADAKAALLSLSSQ